MQILQHQVMDRDPCFRCGTRADVGCRHKPATPVEFTTIAIRDHVGEQVAAYEQAAKTDTCPLCGVKVRPKGMNAHKWQAHTRR